MTEQSVVPTAAAPPGSVHELLRQLVASHFVLTDRDGVVTRWSAPAQALFGWDPSAMLGRPMLETLGVATAPPRHGGRVTAGARLADGREIEVELVFIPVRMSQSLEFNGFLSALEQMSAAALSVERLRSGHYGVVDWIEASMNGTGTLEEDELAAGTIVTFRPLEGAELAFDESPAEDEEHYDDEEIDDFEEIERAIAGTATSVAKAREEAHAARAEAAVASERVGTLEAQGDKLREELEGTRTLVAELRTELEQAREVQPEAGTLDDLREGLEKVRKRVRQAAEQDYAKQIEELRAQFAELRASKGDATAREELVAAVEEQARDARKAAGRVEEAAARAGAAAQTAAAVGEQLDQKVAHVDASSAKAEEAAATVSATVERAEAAASSAAEAGATLEAVAKRAEEAAAAAEQHLEEARKAAEQAAVEAEVARVQAEASQTRPRRRSRPASPKADLHAPLFGREEDTGPSREPRPGFDDAKEPKATIALDGHFRELNKAFSELVGHTEKEFQAASWPPVMDRANLPMHREQMRALVAGEVESADVNTGYVHAQGLLVPVVGKLSLRRSDGEPDHFLLELVRP